MAKNSKGAHKDDHKTPHKDDHKKIADASEKKGKKKNLRAEVQLDEHGHILHKSGVTHSGGEHSGLAQATPNGTFTTDKQHTV